MSRQWLQAAAQRHIAALLERGWTLTQIGAALGVSRTAVAAWDRGQWAPRPERLRALRRLAEASV